MGGVYSGDVYVLSVPSFVWIKVYDDPDLATGRIGSNCLKVLPDQMFVIGGRSSPGSTCLSDGLVKVFNLNNATFQNGYDPAQYNKYQVPSSVYSVIGGKYVITSRLFAVIRKLMTRKVPMAARQRLRTNGQIPTCNPSLRRVIPQQHLHGILMHL